MFGINNNHVSNLGGLQVNSQNETNATSNARAAGKANTSALDSDQTVKVSTAAGALAQITGQSDVRTDKVAQLQAAIANGTYNVSSTDVADKLIESMLGGR